MLIITRHGAGLRKSRKGREMRCWGVGKGWRERGGEERAGEGR